MFGKALITEIRVKDEKNLVCISIENKKRSGRKFYRKSEKEDFG